jgi:hypothetical protein
MFQALHFENSLTLGVLGMQHEDMHLEGHGQKESKAHDEEIWAAQAGCGIPRLRYSRREYRGR